MKSVYDNYECEGQMSMFDEEPETDEIPFDQCMNPPVMTEWDYIEFMCDLMCPAPEEET